MEPIIELHGPIDLAEGENFKNEAHVAITQIHGLTQTVMQYYNLCEGQGNLIDAYKMTNSYSGLKLEEILTNIDNNMQTKGYTIGESILDSSIKIFNSGNNTISFDIDNLSILDPHIIKLTSEDFYKDLCFVFTVGGDMDPILKLENIIIRPFEFSENTPNDPTMIFDVTENGI